MTCVMTCHEHETPLDFPPIPHDVTKDTSLKIVYRSEISATLVLSTLVLSTEEEERGGTNAMETFCRTCFSTTRSLVGSSPSYATALVEEISSPFKRSLFSEKPLENGDAPPWFFDGPPWERGTAPSNSCTAQRTVGYQMLVRYAPRNTTKPRNRGAKATAAAPVANI